MCGISGILSTRLSTEHRIAAVTRMNNAMVHRGPDDGGCGSWEDATLGMRRLAIFDPAHGQQPMSTADGRWHLVFNGAIYNHRELRAQLADFYTFTTHCDTEVLLAAIARWGRNALPRLRGMFAFAAWDSTERSLLIARDSFGIKPLYIHSQTDGTLLFASELNGLFASGLVSAEIDPQSVSDYLSWLSIPAPRTLYRSVMTVRAGECIEWHAGRLTTSLFDDARRLITPADGISIARTRDEFTAGLRVQLEDTVRAHVVADVPVGAFLSGGLDSTALVALMTRLSGSKLKTFFIGFDEAGYSEAPQADENARFLGSDHHTSILTGARVANNIEAIIGTLDQPTGDGINTYYASQAARAGGVTVALSGLGADELFGGYSSLRNTFLLARWLPVWRVVPAPIRNALLAHWNRGDTRARKLADTLRHATSPASLALLQRRVFSESTRHTLLAPGLNSPYAPHPEENALATQLSDAGLFSVTSLADIRGYMTDVLLRDSDVMSMAHSLELRVPFVDRPFVNWVSCQPAAFKYTPSRPKNALKQALGDLIPPNLLTGKKRGFTLPYAVWMRGPLKPFLEDTFATASVSRSGLFNSAAVQLQWRQFLTGSDSVEWSRIWSLAVLIAFLNRPKPMAA